MQNVIRKIIICIFLLIGLGCFSMLAYCNRPPENVLEEPGPSKSTQTIEYADIICGQPEKEVFIHPDYLKIKEINDDLVGLIYFEDMIYEPVVQADDNDYYLRRNINKEYASIGTAFIDHHVKYGDDQNIIIYGHTSLITKGAMFSNLNFYKEKEYWDTHQDFEFYTEKGVDKYKVFAAYVWKPKDVAFFMGYEFENDGKHGFKQFLERVLEVSLYKTNVEVSENDKIITLITCEEKNINNKVVIFGVLQNK